MRWSGQLIEEDERGRLPGRIGEGVVRTFDAPEALDTRFYEVRAKSVINRVPKASRVPFEWTVNPYRGCTHACVYCLDGETAILLADGRTRPLAALTAGDRIIGTELRGGRRHRVATEVLDLWSSVKHAFHVALEDGTELVASGDHRFLTPSGWKHVADDATRRPHLAVDDELVAAGPSASGTSAIGPAHTSGPDDGREMDAGVRVTAIEPLGEARQLYDITTGTGDFVANGVVSHNCFARPTHEYLDLDAGRDFEREIVVKVNAPEVLRAELARPSWGRQHIAMGTNTDPYQWVEGRYELMRGIWEALRDAANPCSILTKSPLVLRDIDLLQEIAARTEVSACLSVPTLDAKAWRASEPRTPHPRARLEAVAELNRAGIPTGVLIAPLMPGINDKPEQVEEIVALATEAGAVHMGGITLHLRGSVRRVFMDWLRGYRPDLVPRYERLYARGAYVPESERRAVERAAELPGRTAADAYAQRFNRTRPTRPLAQPPPAAPRHEQSSLF